MSTAYYRSPIGIIELRSNGTSITAALFINSQKGTQVYESTIVFDNEIHPLIKKCIEELDDYFSGKRKIFTLPLSQNGTDFQQTVWTALTNIPYGRTISYLELSKRIGNHKAIRAVGTTNGKNALCILVPCHRVIGSNGDLVGYGGDLWRKKWLLEHESKFESGVQTLF
ncbi:MAG: methylated-DNA--[protein]-cysteine S-methyltransferase [Bacteroidota bacterium]